MFSKKEQLKIEANLVLMLMELCPDCLLYLGIDEKYVIADVSFAGRFALSRIVNCNHIHRIIKESGTNRLYPRDVFKKMCEKGYLDNVE